MRLEQDESDFLGPRQTIRDQYFAGIDSEPIWNQRGCESFNSLYSIREKCRKETVNLIL